MCVSVCLSVLLFLHNDSRYQKSKKLFCLYGSWEGFQLFFSDRKCLFPVPTMQTGNTNFTVGGREIPQNLHWIISMKKVNYDILLQGHLHAENEVTS